MALPVPGTLAAPAPPCWSDAIIERARCSRSPCPAQQMQGAREIFEMHNVIEEIAYRAFAEVVAKLGIRSNSITEQQSGEILAHIKKQAHVELYKEGGYWKERTKRLEPAQVQRVIQKVGSIIHDRDTKLTDARYYTLSSLLMGLDDHNNYVKEVLLQSWFICDMSAEGHLERIKENVQFYRSMDGQLQFNLHAALNTEKAFWDKYFPGKREVTEECANAFMNILEVREYFGGAKWATYDARTRDFVFLTGRSGLQARTLTAENLDQPLSAFVGNQDVMDDLVRERVVENAVRRRSQVARPLLASSEITVREFLTRYFPDILEQIPA